MPWRRPQHPLPAQRGVTSRAAYARASARRTVAARSCRRAAARLPLALPAPLPRGGPDPSGRRTRGLFAAHMCLYAVFACGARYIHTAASGRKNSHRGRAFVHTLGDRTATHTAGYTPRAAFGRAFAHAALASWARSEGARLAVEGRWSAARQPSCLASSTRAAAACSRQHSSAIAHTPVREHVT